MAAFVVVLVACSPASPAPATTTTTPSSVVGADGSTTTTTVVVDPDGEGFRTRVPGVLVVGTERLTAPWYTGPSPDEITGGIEYRLAREIGSRLGFPVIKIVRTSLVKMMNGQDNCACDMIISGVGITDGRALTLDLTEPYLDADQTLVVRQGVAVSTLTDASLLRLGAAVRDPTAIDAIRSRIKPVVEPWVVVDHDDAVRRILDGRLDGVVMDAPDALALAVTTPGVVIAGKIRTGDQYAVALTLGSPNTALVNDVIRQLRGDGTIANLLTSYLGAQPSDIAVLPP